MTLVQRFVNRVLPVALLALVVGLSSAAQQAPSQNQTSTSGAVRLNRAPVSKDILRVHVPRPVRTTFDNGLRMLVVEDHRAPMIYLTITIEGAGPVYDPATQPGLAEFTAATLREGTASRTGKQIAQEMTRLGIVFAGGVTGTRASLTAVGLRENFAQWRAIFLDMLLHPNFPESEIDLRKEQTLVTLKRERTNASFLADERMQKVLYGDHPAAIVSPTEASVRGMTHDALVRFYREQYVPQNAILAVVGDVQAAEFIAQMREALASWKKTDLKLTLPPNPAPQNARRVFLVDRPDSVQTNLVLGNLAITRRDPDYVPLMVMNEILGGGATGRLFMNLREAKGFTYGAYSHVDAQHFIGTIAANSEVRTAVTDGALTEFFHEFQRLAEQPVSADELEKTKRAMVAGFGSSLETMSTVLNHWLTVERYGLPDNYWESYPEKIMSVTSADVQRVAKKYLDPNAIQVVAVGDAAKIKTALEKWGAVAVYDTDAKPTLTPAAGKPNQNQAPN